MKRRSVQIAVAAVVVAVAIAGFLIFQVFSGDTPPEAALSSSSVSAPSGSGAGSGSGDLAGSWTLNTSSGSLADGSSTFAGYRVEEKLSTLGTHDAVGRTQQVDGSMTLTDAQVKSLDVSVDMTTLTSDDDRRDGQLHERGLETDAFPTATFSLTEPIDIAKPPGVGETIDATATGDLTLHGVTKQVSVPVEARWDGARIEIAGSVDITIADYGIEKPVGFIVLSIADTGTIEFHLLFERA
jgi:polyisoprenoid-binding protein YceI